MPEPVRVCTRAVRATIDARDGDALTKVRRATRRFAALRCAALRGRAAGIARTDAIAALQRLVRRPTHRARRLANAPGSGLHWCRIRPRHQESPR
ncbi:hypothetical protein C6P98_23780 [Burkholderia multivorans]|uniref:Uncharacterized protein n=1 Tax=Burkholderia multivorans TaxID=87883 RepID=A0A8E2RTM9_9BURK|nr:hypothetical protein C6P98_23780 [Burkholderia multivorans]